MQCYGAWCYEITQIGWFSRQAATLLFGAPPESTLEEAEKFLRMSIETRHPVGAYWGKAYLGFTLYKLRRYKDAREMLEAAQQEPAKTERRKRFRQEVDKKLEKCPVE